MISGEWIASVFSSWAEIHGFIMGISFGLLFATLQYIAVKKSRRGHIAVLLAAVLALVVGFAVGLNIQLSPWEGWWHVWYILAPATAITYLVAGPLSRRLVSTVEQPDYK